MKREFHSYTQFNAAVQQAGFSVRLDPPSHEGMHEDDMFEPAHIVDTNGNEVGMGWNDMVCRDGSGDAPDSGEIVFYGVLCDTTAEFKAWEIAAQHAENEEFLAIADVRFDNADHREPRS